MIPKNVREGARAENLPGEKAYFTIKPNGKAFRTLIDGLYSNKVRAVIRELCSNAADSHIDAKQAKPFLVTIPTTLDPTFRVRDYGTSLDHQQVMKLYTTIFESTKEETNEQTGQLGLGSKSPFAYTDTFTVIAYKDGLRRVYIAFLETDGVPSITHVGDEPTDEPQGLEVAFPAKRDDIRQFQREMQFVSMGYKVPPTIEGMDIAVPKPRLQGTNWAIYPQGAFGGDVTRNHFIRQGSVIYPLETQFPHVGYGWITIVEVPIGTAEVTASREALSMDEDTRLAVRGVHQQAHGELTAQIEAHIAAATTRIEKAKVYSEYNGVLDNVRGSVSVSLLADSLLLSPNQARGSATAARIPGDVIEKAEHFGKGANARSAYGRYISSLDYQQLKTFRLLVDDPSTKMVRRSKRIRNAHLAHTNTWVYSEFDPADRKKGVAWIAKCFDLKPEQITLTSDLPDCPPDQIKRAPSMKRVLNPGQLWMPRNGGIINSEIFGFSNKGLDEWPAMLIQAARRTGKMDLLDWGDIFWVNDRQEASYEKKKTPLPKSKRLDVVIKKALDAQVAKAPLDEAQILSAVHNMVGKWNQALPVVMEKFFPTLKITPDEAGKVLELASIAKIDLPSRPIVAKINKQLDDLVAEYPLLFQKSDRKHYEHYVAAVQAAAAIEA